MVDLHTHVLPGVDDGARTMAEALSQLRDARDKGVGALACTPHLRMGETADLSALLDDRRRIHERLVRAADAEGGLPDVGLGAEVLLVDDGTPFDDPGMRINGGPYALTELLFGLRDFAAVRAIFGRILDGGCRPLLAHVERYPHLLGFDLIDQLRQDGVLTQVNASSLVGQHGDAIRRRAEELLDSDRADVVASDAHGPHMRLNYMAEARLLVERRSGPAFARRLFEDVPRTIFDGRPLPAEVVGG
ncbi:MAG: hypothetical protein H0V09_02595 [Gemmatimonadetes bacterium]|nr:hypothetical protein [Gemmatimonadota bacterium]